MPGRRSSPFFDISLHNALSIQYLFNSCAGFHGSSLPIVQKIRQPEAGRLYRKSVAHCIENLRCPLYRSWQGAARKGGEPKTGEIILPFLSSSFSGFFPYRFLLMFTISRLLIPVLLHQMFAFWDSFLCCSPLCCLLLSLLPEIRLRHLFFSCVSRYSFHNLFSRPGSLIPLFLAAPVH